MDLFSNKFNLSWYLVALEGRKLVSESWKKQTLLPTSSSSPISARLLVPLQGSCTSTSCPPCRGLAGYNQPGISLSQFSMSDVEKKKDTLLPPSHFEMEVAPSPLLAPSQDQTTSPNSGNDRLQNVDSAHCAKYLNLHIRIMAFLLSGKESDSPEQAIHRGEETFLLGL